MGKPNLEWPNGPRPCGTTLGTAIDDDADISEQKLTPHIRKMCLLNITSDNL
jgi:hypothetical protein